MPGMKTTKAQHSTTGKAERRARRAARDAARPRRGEWEIVPLGGPVDPLIARRALEAFVAFDPSGPWPDVASSIMPLLKRVRHPFPAQAAPIHLRVPPGVWTGFGIDVGPMWAHVSRDLLGRWGVDDATLLGTALENLRRRVIDEPPIVESTSMARHADDRRPGAGLGLGATLAPDRPRAHPRRRAAHAADTGPECARQPARDRGPGPRGRDVGGLRGRLGQTSSTSSRCAGPARPSSPTTRSRPRCSTDRWRRAVPARGRAASGAT